MQERPDETLFILQRRATWWWIACQNGNCCHAEPVALAPFIIRWGFDVRRSRLEDACRCQRCGKMMARLEHPTRGSMPAKGEPDLTFPVGRMSKRQEPVMP